jgi:hypothetical protein
MEQNTDAVAELVKLGAEQPSFALQLLEQCKEVAGIAGPLDVAVAELKVLAAEQQRKVEAKHEASQLYFDICKQVEMLFRAAMSEVIDQQPYFSLEQLVQSKQLFDGVMVSRFGLATVSCYTDWEGEFVIMGTVCGGDDNPNSYAEWMGPFRAEFSRDYSYCDKQIWKATDLGRYLNGVYLDQMRAEADNLDVLSAIHAWLNQYTVAVQLSRD